MRPLSNNQDGYEYISIGDIIVPEEKSNGNGNINIPNNVITNSTQNEFKSITIGGDNRNSATPQNGNQNFKSIDSYKPENKLVYDTKTISNIDTKLYNLLKK